MIETPLAQTFAMDVWMHEVERRLDALEAEQKVLLARLEAAERLLNEKKDNA